MVDSSICCAVAAGAAAGTERRRLPPTAGRRTLQRPCSAEKCLSWAMMHASAFQPCWLMPLQQHHQSRMQ